jgi:hypothetical protein
MLCDGSHLEKKRGGGEEIEKTNYGAKLKRMRKLLLASMHGD